MKLTQSYWYFLVQITLIVDDYKFLCVCIDDNLRVDVHGRAGVLLARLEAALGGVLE